MSSEQLYGTLLLQNYKYNLIGDDGRNLGIPYTWNLNTGKQRGGWVHVATYPPTEQDSLLTPKISFACYVASLHAVFL